MGTEFDINDCKEVPISSQVVKGTWKLIKRYINSKNHYYGVLKCTQCGAERVVNYYNFISSKHPHKCTFCKYLTFAKKLVNNIYGTVKVLKFEKLETISYKHKKEQAMYFLTECTKCGKQSIRKYNLPQWNATNGCKMCRSTFFEPSYNDLLRSYKKGASERNISWHLSDEEFLNLITKNCNYCGVEPTIRLHDRSKNKKPVNGIDRVDSSKPYTIDNCVTCCTMCNYMKQHHNKEDFLNQVQKIYMFQTKGSTTIEKTSEKDGTE